MAQARLAVTNPILLWLFRHGWEEPIGPLGPREELTLSLAVLELVEGFGDEELRAEVSRPIKANIAKVAEKIAAG